MDVGTAFPPIASLHESLIRDSWREGAGFSPDMGVQSKMWSPNALDRDVAGLLLEWFVIGQPCLFGRAAANRQETITFCILHEEDLLGSDQSIQRKIQSEREIWQIKAARGESSAFFLFATSEMIAKAKPDSTLMMLASRLMQMWLELPEHPASLVDKPQFEDVWLDDGDPELGLEWKVETNFFAAQGDKRWWHDHRVPGGIGFTANSVGHMIESHAKAERLQKRKGSRLPAPLVKSPLRMAMNTILNAYTHPISGTATNLFPVKEPAHSALDKRFGQCPFPSLKPSDPLLLKDYSRYAGWFHTNDAIPSIFFRTDVKRPDDAAQHDDIDFTYLFHADPENKDYWRMTKGLPRRKAA